MSSENSAMQIARSHQHDIRQLPDPDETWLIQDVPLEDRRARQLRVHGLIEQVGRVSVKGTANYRYQYRLDPAVAEAVSRMPEPETPCNHTGVRNLRDGAFSCCRDDCDVEFGREVAEAEARR